MNEKQLDVSKFYNVKEIGASNIATILGLNPWESPQDFQNMALGRSEVQPDADARERMYMGNILEPVIGKVAARHLSIDPEFLYPSARSFRHPKYPFLRATPDFFGGGTNPIVIQAKTTSGYNEKYWPEPFTNEKGDNETLSLYRQPNCYRIQCLFEAAIMTSLDGTLGIFYAPKGRIEGLDSAGMIKMGLVNPTRISFKESDWYLAVLFGNAGWKVKMYRIVQDAHYQEWLIKQAVNFYQKYLAPDNPPEPEELMNKWREKYG